jgi:hypothetical protein
VSLKVDNCVLVMQLFIGFTVLPHTAYYIESCNFEGSLNSSFHSDS